MKVSIVIPVYNVEKYLRKCLDSVCAQDDCVEEIILVNDGSTDNSLEICNEYAKTDKRISIINSENRGVEQAIVTGINAANGDYIGFVDGDDYIDADMFGTLYDTIINVSADMVICGYDRVDENCNFLSRYSLPLPSKVGIEKIGGAFPFEILPHTSGEPFMSYARWNKLFRRECILNNAFFRAHGLRVGEDTALMYSVIFSLSKISYVDKSLYHYVQRANSIVHSFSADYINNWDIAVNVLSNAAKLYEYKIDNFGDVSIALLYHLCIGKVRLSKLPRKQRAAAYKLIGENKHAEELLRSVKPDMPFKRSLVFKLLKHKLYFLLSLIY